MKTIYALKFNDKISSLAFAKLEDAQKQMKLKAEYMNTYDAKRQDVGLTGATYYAKDGYGYKEGTIQIVFIDVEGL